MIVLNLKTYDAVIKNPLYFVDIAKEVVGESGVRIPIAVPAPYLKEAAERYSDVYAQHMDHYEPGAHTGSIIAEMLSYLRVRGTLINHSEKRVARNIIKEAVERAHLNNIETIVCAESPEESEVLSDTQPSFIAVEPPELIGSGISVSTAKPDVIINTVKKVKAKNPQVKVLCGAGVNNKDDVRKALELGAEGVLLASAYVKSKNPKEFLEELASVF
ncbi:MAG: triose-phosphate isomerase [Candidatus Bilamarchaeaceae archaeon]